MSVQVLCGCANGQLVAYWPARRKRSRVPPQTVAMSVLQDKFGRPITYLRLAVTDRCNLRCFYCMPARGIEYVPQRQLLAYEEMLRLVRILAGAGVRKVRITGGEPFLRRDLMPFLARLVRVPGIEAVRITTNGVRTEPFLDELYRLGIRSVNLSLDTLDRARFAAITRRDELPAVWNTLERMLALGFKVKINTVVMAGRNIQDIVPLAELTRELPLCVRFIEEMPFNGDGRAVALEWDYRRIRALLQTRFPDMEKLPDPPHSTSLNYRIPGHRGTIGLIPAYSRTFCGSCNRLRLTPLGKLRTCLYDEGIFNLRDLMRAGASDQQLLDAIREALAMRAPDGFAAERARSLHSSSESMAEIGG